VIWGSADEHLLALLYDSCVCVSSAAIMQSDKNIITQNLPAVLIMRDIRKVTSGELLTKQATRKKLLYIKITYILKLLLNVVTAGIEILVVSENKYMYEYAFVEEICRS
jgi:hypothetical protein